MEKKKRKKINSNNNKDKQKVEKREQKREFFVLFVLIDICVLIHTCAFFTHITHIGMRAFMMTEKYDTI